jgi:hypothetical protein
MQPKVKSVPLFFDFSPSLPSSTVIKILLREILKEPLNPLSEEEIKQLKKLRKGRKRIHLTAKDKDLMDFFFFTPLSVQYAVFKRLNEKLSKEVQS